jgi:hypothetical protein
MYKAVKRDVNARCHNWNALASDYTGASQAVLVADDVHYTGIVGEAIPDSLGSAVEKMKEIVYNLVEHSKTTMSAAHRALLKSRITVAIYWHRVATRLANAEIKDSKDDLW